MSKRALRQYLELMSISGIHEVYRTHEDKGTILEEKRKCYSNCTKCALHEGRIKFVYGEGNPNATAMLIGEAPGATENETGRPFVGEAGTLLDKMLGAIELSRDMLYIANIVKCRPPGNRNPESEERAACLPYLIEQIEIIQPKVFLLLGLVAAQTLLQSRETMEKLRMQEHRFLDRPTFVTYHPAALLRNPNWKKPAWADLQKFRDFFQTLV